MVSVDFLQVPKFAKGKPVILYNKEYRNVFATIKDLDDVNKIAIVITAEGETHRVDYQDMREYKETPDFSSIHNQSIETQDGGYRPVGRGTGKERDALGVVGNALKRLEKELYAMKVPVVGVKYESTQADKWHNGLNALWQGNVNFNIEFLDINGQKHCATIRVPIENGLVQTAKYVYDNFNRKFNLTAEGIQDMLKHINPVEESSDAAVYDVPGTEKTTAETKDKMTKEADKKPMDKKAMYETLANGSWRYIKNIVQDEDERGKLKELLSLRDLVDNEIKNQEMANEQNGLDRNHNIDYDRKNRINNTLFEILDKYEGNIKNHFNPQPMEAMVNRVLRNIKAKQGPKDPDEEMMVEKEHKDTKPGEKKKTHQKRPSDKQLAKDNVFNTSMSAVPAGTGTRELNDMTDKDPGETQYTK